MPKSDQREAPEADLSTQVMAIVPAYNSASSVGEVVKGIVDLRCGIPVLVVDDGSTDATAEVARHWGALVKSHPTNLGKGEALRTGFEHFLASGLGAAVTLDADGQHDPAEIPRLVVRWRQTGADIVIGTRERDPSQMPPLRRLTNAVSSWMVSVAAGQRIRDSQSGFRLLSREVVGCVRTKAAGYDAESEILVKAAAKGFKVESAPISTIYGDERSHINPFKQPILFMWVMLKSIFWRLEASGIHTADQRRRLSRGRNTEAP
ncbi:MAG: glycosyltransferase family 2 protein [bacterium]